MVSTTRTIVFGALAGAGATFVKGRTEGILQPLAERAFPPAAAAKTAIGADAAGHPENMPPSELADRALHAVTGGELDDDQRTKVSEPLHWGMGVGFGVAYALVARRVPAVRAAYGLVAGAGLFAATHGSALPAAGLQHPPWTMPTAWWGWEAGSHLVYGVALDRGLALTSMIGDRR